MARIKTTTTREVIRPCTACGKVQKLELHHILTRGSRPDLRDRECNHVYLCTYCHSKAHSMGLNSFYTGNVRMRNYLIERGWEFDEYSKKWLPPQGE